MSDTNDLLYPNNHMAKGQNADRITTQFNNSRNRRIFANKKGRQASSLWRWQSTVWSLTIPVACMNA